MSADRAFNSGSRDVSRLIGYDDSSNDDSSNDDLSEDDLSTPLDGALGSARAEVPVCE